MGTREFLWNVYRYWTTGSSRQQTSDEEPTTDLPSAYSLGLPGGTSTTLPAVHEQIDNANSTSFADIYRRYGNTDEEDTISSIIAAAALRDPPPREEGPIWPDDVGIFAPVVLPTTGHGAAGLTSHRGQNPRPQLVPERQHRPVPCEEADSLVNPTVEGPSTPRINGRQEPSSVPDPSKERPEPAYRRYPSSVTGTVETSPQFSDISDIDSSADGTRFVERIASSTARKPSIGTIRNVADENRPMVLPVEADVSNGTDEQEYMSFDSSILFPTKSFVGPDVGAATIRTAATSMKPDQTAGAENATSTTNAFDGSTQPSVTGSLFGMQRTDRQDVHVLRPVNGQHEDRRPFGFDPQVTDDGTVSHLMMRARLLQASTPPRGNIILRRADGSTPFRPLHNRSTIPEAEQYVDGSFSGRPPSIPQQEGGSYLPNPGINHEASALSMNRHRGGFCSDLNAAGETRGLLGLDVADTNTRTAFDEANLLPTYSTPAFPFGQEVDWGKEVWPANLGENRRKLPLQQAPGFAFAPSPVTATPFYFGRSSQIEPPAADAGPPSPMDVDPPDPSINQASPGTSSRQMSEELPCTQAPNLAPITASWQFGDQGSDAPFVGASLPAPQDQPAATGTLSSFLSAFARRKGKKKKSTVPTPASRQMAEWFVSCFSTAAVGKPEVSPTDVSPPRVQYEANRAAQPLPIPVAHHDDTIVRVQPGIFGHSYSQRATASAAVPPGMTRPSNFAMSAVDWRLSEIAANSSALPSQLGMTPAADWTTATPNIGFRPNVSQPPISSAISSRHSSWTAMHRVEPPAGPSYGYPPLAAEGHANFTPAPNIASMPSPPISMPSLRWMQEVFDNKISLGTADGFSAAPQKPVGIETARSQPDGGGTQNAQPALQIATVTGEPEDLKDKARAVPVGLFRTEPQVPERVEPPSRSEEKEIQSVPKAPSLTPIVEEIRKKSQAETQPPEQVESNPGDSPTFATSVAPTITPIRSSRLRLPPPFLKRKPAPIRPDNKRKMPSIDAEELHTETSVCDFDPTAPSAKRRRMVDMVKGAPRKYHREDRGFLSILTSSVVEVASEDKPPGSALFKPVVQARLQRQLHVERALRDLELSTIANISKILGNAGLAKDIVSSREIPGWFDKKSKQYIEVVQQLTQYSRFMEDTILAGTRTESTGSDSGPSSQKISTSQNNDPGKRDVENRPRTALLTNEKPPSASETTLAHPFERTTTAGTDGERSRAGADESSILLFSCSQTVDDGETQEGTQVDAGSFKKPQQLQTGSNDVQSSSKAAVEASIEDVVCLSQDGTSMVAQNLHASSEPSLGTSHRLISFDSTLADSVIELMPPPLQPSRPGTAQTAHILEDHQENKENSEQDGFSIAVVEGDLSDDKTYSVQDVDETLDDNEEGSSVSIELIELGSEVDLPEGNRSNDTAIALSTENAALTPENQGRSPQLVSFQSANEVCVARLQDHHGFDVDSGRQVSPTRRFSNLNKRQRDVSGGSDLDDGFEDHPVRNGSMYYDERYPPKRRKLRHEGCLASSNLDDGSSISGVPVSPDVHVLPDNQVMIDLVRSVLVHDSVKTSDDRQLPLGLPSLPIEETSAETYPESAHSLVQLNLPAEADTSSCLFEQTAQKLNDEESDEDDGQIMKESSPADGSVGPADSSDTGQLPLGLPSSPAEETSAKAQLDELASSVVQLTLPVEMGGSSSLLVQADQQRNTEEAGDGTRQTELQRQPEPHRRTIRIPRKNTRKHLSLPSRLRDTTYLEISLEGSVLEEDDSEAVVQPSIVLPSPNGASGNSDVAQDLVQQPVGAQDTSLQEPDDNISSKETSTNVSNAQVGPREDPIAQMVATARLWALQPTARMREASTLAQNSSSQGEKRSIETGRTVPHQENQQQDPDHSGFNKEECPTGTKKDIAGKSIIPAASRKVSFDIPDKVHGGRSNEISQLRKPSIKNEPENYVDADDQHPLSSTTEEETFGSTSISFGAALHSNDSCDTINVTNLSEFSAVPSGGQSPHGNTDDNLTGFDFSHYEEAEAADVEQESLSASSNTSVQLSSFSDGPEPSTSRNTPVISPKTSEEETDDPEERTGAGQVPPLKLDSRPETSLLLQSVQASSSQQTAINERRVLVAARRTANRNKPTGAAAEEDEEKAGPEKRAKSQAPRHESGTTSHPAPSNCAGRSTNKQSKSGSREPSVPSLVKRRGTAGSKSSVPENCMQIDEQNIIFKTPAFAYLQEHRKRAAMGSGTVTIAKPKPLDGMPDETTIVVFQGDKNTTYLVQKGQRATLVKKNGLPTKYVMYFHVLKPSSDSSASRKVGKKALLVRTSSKREAHKLCSLLRKAIKNAELALPGF